MGLDSGLSCIMPFAASPVPLILASCFLALTFGATFYLAHRRHTGVSGTGWWAWAGGLGAVAFAGLFVRLAAGSISHLGFSNTALVMAALCAWMGVRSHLGLPVPVRAVVATGAVLLVVNAVIFNGPWPLPIRPASFMVELLLVLLCSFLDLLLKPGRLRNGGERALVILTGFELVTLVTLGSHVVEAPDAGRYTLASAEVGMVAISFFVSSLMRLVVYLALVSIRLQELHDKAQAVLKLRDAESWEMLESLQAGVVSLASDGRIARSNTLGRSMLALKLLNDGSHDPDRLHIERWVDTGGTALLPGEAPHDMALLHRAPVRDFVVGVPSETGNPLRWLLCNALLTAPVEADRPKVVVTFVDVTEVKLAQAREREMLERHALAQRMEALGALASGVAHDFNNLLAAVQGNVSLLSESLPTDDPSRTTLTHIDRAARRGRGLAARILAFGRQQGVRWESVDLVELLQDTSSLMSAVRKPGVTIECICPSALPPVLGDPTQLTQILLNLGTNAIQAVGRSKGWVRLKADAVDPDTTESVVGMRDFRWRPLQQLVRISVEDNGCGMDGATQARMFEAFFTTKPVGEGSGLGLATVRGIVDTHGGRIEVESTLGQGTRITLWLPSSSGFSNTQSADPVAIA